VLFTCSCKTIRKLLLLLLVRRTGNLCSLLVFILQEHRHQYNIITVVTTIFRFARTFSHSGFYVSGCVEPSYETRKRKRPTGTEQANDLTTPDGLRSAIVRCNSDGAIDDFPVSRRRSHFFFALPKTRARGHDYYQTHRPPRMRHRDTTFTPNQSSSSWLPDVYGATVKRALNHRCFFKFLFLLPRYYYYTPPRTAFI